MKKEEKPDYEELGRIQEEDLHDLERTLRSLRSLTEKWDDARLALEEALRKGNPRREVIDLVFKTLDETAEEIYLATGPKARKRAWRSLQPVLHARENLYHARTAMKGAVRMADLQEAVRQGRAVEEKIRRLIAVMLLARKGTGKRPIPQSVRRGRILLEKAGSYRELESRWKDWLQDYLRENPNASEIGKKKEEMTLAELRRLFGREVERIK